jgi:hypothetical protein
MPIGTTAAILVGSALTAAATTYAAETAKKGQKQALRQQEKAQTEATRMATAEREMAGAERRRMEGKTPDVAALLTGEQGAQGRGAASTLLTGNTRIGDQMDRIGKNNLLGE